MSPRAHGPTGLLGPPPRRRGKAVLSQKQLSRLSGFLFSVRRDLAGLDGQSKATRRLQEALAQGPHRPQ